MVKLVGVKKLHQPKMKILILAIVVCVVDGQVRGYNNYGRPSYNGYARQDAVPEPQTDSAVTGEQMMLFLIKTLKNLQSLFESYQWDDLYQRPDTTMQLPNKFQERRRQGQGQDPAGWNPFLTPPRRPATPQTVPPRGRQAFPRPPPPPSRVRSSRPRRSEDAVFRGHDPNIMQARPIRTTTTRPPTTTTTARTP